MIINTKIYLTRNTIHTHTRKRNYFPDLEWKVVYVGSADDETQDQELDSVLVGPVAVGSYRFVFQADAPDPSRIPPEDLLGVTVVLLTCSYRGQEFLRAEVQEARRSGDQLFRRSRVSEASCSEGQEFLRSAVQEAKSS